MGSEPPHLTDADEKLKVLKKLDGVRALCIDDDADMRRLLAAILTRYGADVTLCHDAETAIARLSEDHFDIVISDLNMPPGLDGYDLIHALRKMEAEDESRQATPAVLVSANARDPSPKRRFSDFQVYVQKPYSQALLVDIVERLVEADGAAVHSGSLVEWEADQVNKLGKEVLNVAQLSRKKPDNDFSAH